MRIVAGSARGRRIAAPAGTDTRPTGDRVREAIFNSLWSMGLVEGATAVDPFAGSGALGLEALSRGAAHVTFVERDRRTADLVRSNLTQLDLDTDGRATVVVGDAMAHLPTMGPVDVALLDPPYAFDRWDDLLDVCPASVAVVESDREVDPPPGWELTRQKRYGTTVVTIVSRSTPDPSE
ncbi:MAG: 16S rRNA (guanine(966)-N(2))-methyltransferase RsmD [Acidimicrobiales bacterium]